MREEINGQIKEQGERIVPFTDISRPLASVSQVFHMALKSLEKETTKLNMVFRCGNLPQVPIEPEELQTFFTRLLRIIIMQPPIGSRILLFLDSREERNELMDLRSTGGFKPCQVILHSNVSFKSGLQTEEMQQCCRHLTAFGGTLAIDNINNAGCSFVISLPGKY